MPKLLTKSGKKVLDICVQAQWESFGVSYWQILPQINGFEICPIHKEPIRESSITHRDIRYNFFPASNVLGKARPQENTEHLRWVDQHQDEFLRMAEDINYLFQFSYTGFHFGLKVQKTLQYDLLPVHHYWRKILLNDLVLEECEKEIDPDFLITLLYDTAQLVSQIQHISVCLQLRICRAMFGSIENFCTARI